MSEVSAKELNPQSSTENSFDYKHNASLIGIGAFGLLCNYGLISIFQETNLFLLINICFSLAILLGACEFIIEYAVRLSRLLGISELIIGLTVVSIGTSIPEIFTAMTSAYYGYGGLIIGDIYGSYITQLSLIMGVVILFNLESVSQRNTPYAKKDTLLMMAAIAINAIVIFIEKGISTTGSLMLIFLYILYVAYRYNKSKHSTLECAMVKECLELTNISKKKKYLKGFLYLGFVFLFILITIAAAQIMVLSSGSFARNMNVDEHVIGVTIIAFGTAVPEFVVSVAAMRRKEPEIAYGNLLGSNVVDPLLSTGLGAMVRPISMSNEVILTIITNVLPFNLLCGLAIILLFSNKNKGSKKYGLLSSVVLISIYIAFVLSAISF